MWHLCINWIRFLYIGCFEKKPLSFFWNSFSFSRYMYFKNMCKIGKFWDPKIRAQRWIQFSQYATPVGKVREVIVLWPVMNKNLWEFFKMILQSLIIPILKWFIFIVKHPFRWLRASWNFGLSCRKLDLGSLETILKPRFSTETYVLIFLSGLFPQRISLAFGG